MAPRHTISARTLLVIVSVITLVLLAGSAILERLVFHAAEVDSSLYLNGPTAAVTPQSLVSYTVSANLTGNAVIAGGQFVISYDPTLLTLDSVAPSTPWQTVRLLNQTSGSNRLILWSVVPSDDQGSTVQLTGPVSFGTIHFTTLQSGLATIAFDQAQTIIAGVDGSNNQTVYNAVSSVQSSDLVISQSLQTLGAAPAASSLPGSVAPTTVGSLQRILSTRVLAGSSQAVLLTSLKYNGLVTVRFGTSRALGGQVSSQTSSNQAATLISSLAMNTRYFYQVSVADPADHSTITGAVQSFTTTEQSAAAANQDQSSFQLFPALTAHSTDLYLVLRDSDGNTVTAAPTVTVTGGAAAVTTTELSPGLWVAAVTNSAITTQTTTVATAVAGSQFNSQSVVFNPAYHTPNAPADGIAAPLHLTLVTLALLSGLTLVLLLATVAFIRLLGVH